MAMAARQWMGGLTLVVMLALVALTMAIIWVHAAADRSRSRRRWRGSASSRRLVIGFGIDVPRVGDLASIKGGLPAFHIPMVPFDLRDAGDHPALCVHPGRDRPDRKPADAEPGRRDHRQNAAAPREECVAQGVANTVTGFFGGMGGCAMIGQSMINVKSGGRTRLSGIAAALFLLVFILFASPPDRADPAGRAGRRDVHGGDRHLRLADR